jgi:ADP-ribose pyrophosphatase
MRSYVPKNARLLPPEAKLVFKGVIYDTYQWQQKMYDGSYATFEMLKRPDNVKTICIKDDKIVVTEQQQPSLGVFYDLPGGRHDEESETELDCAKRELLEETGMSFKNWKLVEVNQMHNKIDSLQYVFIATGFEKQVEQNLESGEKIKVKLMDLDEVKRLCAQPADHEPFVRYLPKDIFEQAESINQLAGIKPLK